MGGAITVPHVSMMCTEIELEIAAARAHVARQCDSLWAHPAHGGDAATLRTTSAPMIRAGGSLPLGPYALSILPHTDGVDLVVNRQTWQWGTQYSRRRDVGQAPMRVVAVADTMERFTIGSAPSEPRRGSLRLACGARSPGGGDRGEGEGMARGGRAAPVLAPLCFAR